MYDNVNAGERRKVTTTFLPTINGRPPLPSLSSNPLSFPLERILDFDFRTRLVSTEAKVRVNHTRLVSVNNPLSSPIPLTPIHIARQCRPESPTGSYQALAPPPHQHPTLLGHLADARLLKPLRSTRIPKVMLLHRKLPRPRLRQKKRWYSPRERAGRFLRLPKPPLPHGRDE